MPGLDKDPTPDDDGHQRIFLALAGQSPYLAAEYLQRNRVLAFGTDVAALEESSEQRSFSKPRIMFGTASAGSHFSLTDYRHRCPESGRRGPRSL